MRSLTTIGMLALVLVAGIATACGGSPAPAAGVSGAPAPAGSSPARVIARPAALADLPEVTLLTPAELGVGRAPTFSWTPVTGATTYRLVVLGPDAPRWAWTGTATSVRYGGTTGEDGPSLVAGSWWSVVALDEGGGSVALSVLRAVSPGNEPGPEPAWLSGLPAPTSTQVDPVASPAPEAATALTACGLVNPDELSAALGRTFQAGAPSGFAMGTDDCTFPTASNAEINVDLGPRSGYLPDLWSPDQRPIPGLGEDSFLAKTPMDTKVGFVRGEHAVLLTFSFGRVDADQLVELARAIDARIQDAG